MLENEYWHPCVDDVLVSCQDSDNNDNYFYSDIFDINICSLISVEFLFFY